MTPETKEILDSLQVDLEKTLPRFLNKEEFYIGMLKRFPADENYGKLKESLQSGEYEEVFKHAHSLKGLSANLGLSYFYEAVAALTDSVRNGPFDSAEISELGEKAIVRYGETVELISKL